MVRNGDTVQLNRFKYSEPFLEERVERAKNHAERIAEGDIQDENDLFILFRTVISEYYRIPLYSDYFSERTLDELAFEAHYIKAKQTPVADKASDMISKNLADAAAAAEEAWKDIEELVPSEDEMKRMTEFMETGRFEGEN